MNHPYTLEKPPSASAKTNGSRPRFKVYQQHHNKSCVLYKAMIHKSYLPIVIIITSIFSRYKLGTCWYILISSPTQSLTKVQKETKSSVIYVAAGQFASTLSRIYKTAPVILEIENRLRLIKSLYSQKIFHDS